MHFAQICMILLISIGVPGNLAALCNLVSAKQRHRSSSAFVVCLTLCNMLFLACQLPQVLLVKGPWTQETCSVVLYINYVSSSLSSWSITFFTFERFVAVFFPMYHRRWIRGTNFTTVTVLILILTIMLYQTWILVVTDISVAVVFTDFSQDQVILARSDYDLLRETYDINITVVASACDFKPEYGYTFGIFSILEFIFCFSLPLAILIVLNWMISYRIIRSNKTRVLMQIGDDARRRASQRKTGVCRRVVTDESRLNRGPSISLKVNTNEETQNRSPALRPRSEDRQRRLATPRRRKLTGENAKELRVTLSLVSLCVCYLVLNLPFYLIKLLTLTNTVDQDNPNVLMVNTAFHLVYTVQFAVNFLLFSFNRLPFIRVSIPMIKRSNLARTNNGSTTFNMIQALRQRRANVTSCVIENAAVV